MNRTNDKSEIAFLEALEPEGIVFQDPDPIGDFLLTIVIAEPHARLIKSAAETPPLRKGNVDVTFSN